MLLKLFLDLLHFKPFLLLYLMEIVHYKTADQTFCAYYFVLIEHKYYLMWSVDPDISDGLRSYFMLIVYVDLNNSFWSEVHHTLAWITTAKIKYDFFVWIVFCILSQEIVIFHAVPSNWNCCKVFGWYFVRRVDKSDVYCTENRCSSGHGLAWIQCFWRFNVKYRRNDFLNHRNTWTTSNQLDINILNAF